MKKQLFKLASLALAAAFAGVLSVAALAQTHPVEGTYTVASTSSEMGTVNFVMVIKKTGDKWTSEIKDSPIPLTVTTTTVDAENNVVVVADAGGTNVEIKGKFDAGKIKGAWSAGDMKGTWEAAKKDAAMAAAAAPATPAAGGGASAMAGLEGTYDAKVIADGQGELPLTLVIKSDAGKLKTEVPSGGDLNIVDIKVEGETITLVAQYQGQGPIMLPGKRNADGSMGGKWEFGGFSGTWSAAKKK